MREELWLSLAHVCLGFSIVVYPGILDPSTHEALACQEALSLAKDIGVHLPCIASDCLTVTRNIKEGGGGHYGEIIKEITSWKLSFATCTFVHEARSSNYKAHNLGRHTFSLDHGWHIWLGQSHDRNITPLTIVIHQ